MCREDRRTLPRRRGSIAVPRKRGAQHLLEPAPARRVVVNLVEAEVDIDDHTLARENFRVGGHVDDPPSAGIGDRTSYAKELELLSIRLGNRGARPERRGRSYHHLCQVPVDGGVGPVRSTNQ